ncbi:MAG: T9SS type A sorting domain-containing protein, partial [Phaeodactylibacter sp.]|nr:T9SS type A sorting domain-containing protein [Phaeodactylibacter sp.]
MKTSRRFLLALSLMCWAVVLLAQEPWDLFPYGQRSYFEMGESLKLHYNDSTEINGAGRRHLLGAFYYGHSFGPCSTELFNNPDFLQDILDYPNIEEIPVIDAYYSLDGIFSKVLSTDTLKFNTLATPGTTWTQIANNHPFADSFEITCTSILWDTIQGYEDSVKTFTFQAYANDNPIDDPVNELQWRLAKNLGLIEYFKEEAFFEMTPTIEPIRLIGFTVAQQNYGMVPSRELVTRSYAVGNIYKWEFNGYDNSGYDNWHGEYVDSVISIQDTLNSFTVTVQRFGYIITNGQFQYFSNENYYDFPADMDAQWARPTDWFVTDTLNGCLKSLHWRKVGGSYSFLYDFYDDECTSVRIYFDNCSWDFLKGFYAFWRNYRTDIGFHSQCDGSFYGSNETRNLIGYIIGTDTVGNITPVSTQEIPLNSQPLNSIFKLYPNPADKVLHSTLLHPNLATESLTYQLYDSRGRLLFSEKRSGPSQQFDIAALAQGLYILIIQTP